MKTFIWRFVAVCFCGMFFSGCVMAEKYEQEKSRGLNFQRLLAQEEKRTAELDAELKKTRRQLTELESKNREFSGELQTVRDQLTQTRQEAEMLQEASLSRSSGSTSTAFGAEDDPLAGLGITTLPGGVVEGVPIYHEVVPGETLFRLSRTYGVKVGQIKDWNGLTDNLIEVGQQLVVGYE